MTSDLLRCTICPKKPKFSDVSHLLTHVGSKGHLAHLHSLQVRSHQETDAGQKLTLYNQWFQDHGVASLLSERMQQKEQKQAAKKAANRRRNAATESGSKSKVRKALKVQHVYPAGSAYSDERHTLVDKEESVDIDDLSFAGVCATSHYPVLVSSPPRMHPEAEDEDGENADDTELAAKGSPGSPKLKGTQWPGMALFDAASAELKRKRNQKKDGSVLKRLERNAAAVHPTETVHSAASTVLKHRHMDDMEDDSPVEGEETIAEPSPKRRKPALPRSRRQANIGASKPSRRSRRVQMDTPSKPQTPPVMSLTRSTTKSSPSEDEDEDEDVKPVIRGPIRDRRKKNTFTVYEDSSPPPGVDGSSDMMPSAYIDAGMVRPQLMFKQLPSFRRQTEVYDPFKLVRDRLPSTTLDFADLGRGKENYQDSFFAANSERDHQAAINPLYFHDHQERYGVQESYTSIGRSMATTTLNMDRYIDNDNTMPSKNPLLMAMEQLSKKEAADDDFAFDDSSTQYRQPLFAP